MTLRTFADVGDLFAAGGLDRRFNLLLSSFFLLFQASLLSGLLIIGLIILPTFVLHYAVIFLHGKTTRASAGRSYALSRPGI